MKVTVKHVGLGLGILFIVALITFFKLSTKHQAEFNSVYPFDNGVYSTGIVESDQVNGSNINIYPEVPGRVIDIFVKDGQLLKKDDPILAIDDSVQRELVAKDQAQIQYEQANLLNVQQQYQKIHRSRQILQPSVSKNTVDNSANAVKIAEEGVKVAVAQYNSDKALLDKYRLKSPVDGRVLRVVPAIGNYVSMSGTYDTYAQTLMPVILMETNSEYLQVRCFLDEILVPNLPEIAKLKATLFVRGRKTNGIPLEFINLQPFTVPNTQLSNEHAERVDVRVLPIIFRFKKPTDMRMYPGQLVDIYLKG